MALAWVNDETTLRTDGSKTDAYAVFKTLLGKNRPPDEWNALLKGAEAAVGRSKQLLKRGCQAK